MKRTSTLVVAVAVAVAAGLTGCSSGASEEGQVTLRFALWDPGWAEGYADSIAQFEQQHPNIDVQLEQTVWDTYWSKLQTELTSGSGPDVFNNHSSYYSYFATSGAIIDLSPLAEEAGIDLGMYDQDLIDLWTKDGSVYGIPTDVDTIGVFYNTALTDEAGLTAEQLNSLEWNPDDGGTFVQAMQALTLDANGLHPDDPGFDASNVAQWGMVLNPAFAQGGWWNFVASNGGALQTEPFGEWTLDDPKVVESIQFLYDLMYKYHVMAPPANDGSAFSLLFGQQKAATYWDGSWSLTGYSESFADFEWSAFKVPDGPAGAGASLDGTAMSINAASEHPEEAWELIQWLAGPESQAAMGGGGYLWPSVVDEQHNYVDYWAGKGLDVSAFAKSDGNLVVTPASDHYNEIWTSIAEVLDPMWLQQTPVEEAVKEANERANAVG